MNYFRATLLVLTMVCLVTSNVFALTINHEKGLVQITVPDKWTQESDGDTMLIAAPDKTMAVTFMVLPSEAIEKAFEEIDNSLDKKLGTVKWENDGKSKPADINGMKGEAWEGSAKEGKMKVYCILLDTPSDNQLGIYWFCTSEAEKVLEKDVDTIIQGLKPMPAPAKAGDSEDGEGDEKGE